MSTPSSLPGDSPGSLPTVSVVIPVYNGVDLLRGCLRAVVSQTYPAELVEILVVDNNSEENIADALPQDGRVRLLHESRRGSYAARNKALAQASGEVVAFTDADCTPHRDWLERGVEALRSEPEAAMVGGAINLVYASGEPRTGAEVYEQTHSFKQDWYLTQNRYAATANVLTWRRTLDEVGLFDPTLKSRGDAQWGQRVAAAGGLQRYAAEAVVDHPARATWRELMTKQLRVARGRRDVDLVQRPRLRHFLGNAASQVRSSVTTPVTVWRSPPVSGPVRCARYTAVALAIRGIYAATWLGGAARLILRRRRGE